MLDIYEGFAKGKALDMSQGGQILNYDGKITGTKDYSDIAGADVVVVTSGFPRQPGMSREDLIGKNADIISQVGAGIRDHAPDSMINRAHAPAQFLDSWAKSCILPARAIVRVPMTQDLHPEYTPVIFQDMRTGNQFITRSTANSGKTESLDGVDHFVISIGVTAYSQPFFTGQKQFVDTEGRIDKFQKRFGAVRRAKKPVRSEEKPES